MRKYFFIFVFITISLVLFSDSISAAQNRVNTLSDLNKEYSKAIQNLINKTGIFKSGSDYLYEAICSQDPLMERLKDDVEDAVKKINKARANGTSNEEMSLLELQYQEAKQRENKQFIAIVESKLYSSMDYVFSETIDNSLKSTTKVISDFLSNWKTILEPLLEGDFGGVLKNAVLQMIDSTYKVTFINYCISNYGATKKIANHWWKIYFHDPFQNTEEKKLIDKVLTNASNDLKEKLKEKLTERMKLEIIKAGQELTEEAIEKSVKEKAEGILKNLIDTPSLFIELFTKYYNVADFQMMFNESADNEILFIKQIRELVGNDESEIDKCYFDKNYFLKKRKISLDKNNELIKKQTPVKPKKEDEKILPEEIITKVYKEINEKDPADEIISTVTLNEKTEDLKSSFNEEEIPSPLKSEQLIDESFEMLERNEISLASYNNNVSIKILPQYSSAVNNSMKKMLESLDNDYKYALITTEEYNDRKKEIEELSNKNINEIIVYSSKMDSEIKDNQNNFKENFSSIISGFDGKDKLNEINSNFKNKIENFLAIYKTKDNQTYSNTQYFSFSSFMTAFSKENTGIGEKFIKGIYNDSPNIFLVENGKWILENLFNIMYFEEDKINENLEGVNSLLNKIYEMIKEAPEYYYFDINGNNTLIDEINKIENYKTSLLNRMGELQELNSELSEWNYFAGEKIEKTKTYLKAYTTFQGEEINIFDYLMNRIADNIDDIKFNFIKGWMLKIRKIEEIFTNMYQETITPEEAIAELNILETNNENAQLDYENWKNLREELSTMSRNISNIKNNGVSLLHINEKSVDSDFLKELIKENKDNMTEAEKMLSEYNDADLFNNEYNLEQIIQTFSEQSINFEKYPDESIKNEFSYEIRSFIRSIFVSKGGLNYNLKFSNPNIIGISYGNLASAKKLCEEFREFLTEADNRGKAVDEVNKLFEEKYKPILNHLEKEVNEIISKVNFTTEDKKQDLLEELNEAISEADEKTSEIYNNYGIEYDIGDSGFFSKVKTEIENIDIREVQTTNLENNSEDVFEIIENPSSLSQGKIYWLDVMENGYPGFRFRLSEDNDKLLMDQQSKDKFRFVNLSKEEFQTIDLPEKALKIMSSGKYNFQWLKDNEILVYSYDGEGVIIKNSEVVSNKTISSLSETSIIGISPFEKYVLVWEQSGKIYVVDSTKGSYENIGTTYFDKCLQWIPGEDKIIFVDENNKINIYDVNNKEKNIFDNTINIFDDIYSFAVLPGGEWLVYGLGFELKLLKLDTMEETTILQLKEDSPRIIAGVYPLNGNKILVLWIMQGEKFDYGIQVCEVK